MPDAVTDQPDRERAAIARRAGVVAIGTLFSRVLGAVRDAAIAAYFSVAATDAFFVAWTIPNTLRRVLGEGAVSAAIVPVFSEVRETEGKERARAYVAAINGTMLLILSVVSVLGVLTSSFWTTLYAAGYQNDPAKFSMTVQLTQIVFPYILFVGMAALGMGLLNSVGRFGVAAFAPTLLNVAVILAPFLFVAPAIWLGLPSIAALALATLVGGVLQVVVQWPELRREGLLPLPRLDFSDPAVQKTLKLMGPLVLGSGIYQLNIMLSRLFASYLPTGSQSFLYYAQRLVEIPQSLFALAVASATLPSLARLKSQGEHSEAKATLRYSLRLSLFVAIPSSVALVVLSEPTIAVLFRRGAFGDYHVRETARALAWMAASTWAVAAIHPITRMYYAYNDTRTPVWCSALNLVAFVAVSLSLRTQMGHAAIAAGTSAGAVAQLLGLMWVLPKRVGDTGAAEVYRSALRCTLASLIMGAVVYDVARFGRWSQPDQFVRNLVVYGATVLFGVLVYAAACSLLRAPELSDLQSALGRRRRRA
ncbi:MAG TPA: murein biosynthesis integral membrane protein MurJ [Polyangiales bacterium]|nr:murein biosynthesis integral membrane protein MurJ [Polyangiales bacterium]